MNTKTLTLAFLALVLGGGLVACFDKKYDRNAIAEEQATRQIKRLTDGQITSWVFAQGQEMIARIRQNPICQDSITTQYEGKIQVVRFKDTTVTSLHPYALQLLEAYQYSAEQQVEAPAANVKLFKKENKVLFLAPYIENNQLVGMWSVELALGRVIRYIDPKQLQTQ
ncbi:hypothetical protein [Eisenibacter elegans]|jgi:hypothetical protein|uniref:hypothetical protein n=1 Tax=Eisenibacter elegans TaxID=997 RepID=UPI00047A0207|nr:hypothetical protein [Eisenibacter elegans]